MVVRRSPTLMCCVTNHRSWAGSPPHPRCGEHSMRSPPQRRRGSRHPRVPASKVAGTDLGNTIVLDVDATIVIAHSEKELASATFKKTWGFHPLGVWCDNTAEFLT